MKNIKDYCVPHSIAMILNQKQFDEPCFAFYSEQKQLIIARGACFQSKDNFPTAPIFEQVFDWLDKTHKIRISLGTAKTSGKYRFDILQFTEDKWQGDYNLTSFYDSRDRNIKAIETALQLI